MAKQPETIDRFRVYCDIEKPQLGDVIAELTKLGIKRIGHELITDVLSFKERKDYVIHAVNAREFTREYVNNHPTFEIKELVKHFEDSGRNSAGAYQAARLLIQEGVLRKVAPGQYQSVAVKALPAPKTKVPVKAKDRPVLKTRPKVKYERPAAQGKTMRYYDTSNKDFLMNLLKGRTEISASVIRDAFHRAGRPGRSASSMITQFAHMGYLKKLGEGDWKVLAKVQKVKGSIAKKRSTPGRRQVVNGADMSPPQNSVSEETANG